MEIKDSTDIEKPITLDEIIDASHYTSGLVRKSPIIYSDSLDKIFRHKLCFKIETKQDSGSFKQRGVINTLMKLEKTNDLPDNVVTYGTGNHGVALAWSMRRFGFDDVRIYLPHFASDHKKKLAREYGADVVITETRAEAESRAQYDANNSDYMLMHPSDSNDSIAAAAVIGHEAFQQIENIDAIFVPIGGGSLSAGTVLAKNLLSPTTKVYAGEPANANDAYISYKTGKIFRFDEAKQTLADGATALGITERVFQYVKQLDGIYEISEREIEYWTAHLCASANIICEPTSALALAAAYRWSLKQESKTSKKLVIVITGRNIDEDEHNKIHRRGMFPIFPDDALKDVL